MLLLDAASTRVQAGWLEPPSPSSDSDFAAAAHWRYSDDEATTAVFECVNRLGHAPSEAAAFIFCEGPGSVLGIRTTAMALRTWNVLQPRPVFAYCSLALVAHARPGTAAGVIADARRDSWHHYQIGRGLRRVPPAALAGELVMPENFRHWSALPEKVTPVPYSLATLLPLAANAELFLACDNPDAFLHEEPNYLAWTPQIHRAPGERGLTR